MRPFNDFSNVSTHFYDPLVWSCTIGQASFRTTNRSIRHTRKIRKFIEPLKISQLSVRRKVLNESDSAFDIVSVNEAGPDPR